VILVTVVSLLNAPPSQAARCSFYTCDPTRSSLGTLSEKMVRQRGDRGEIKVLPSLCIHIELGIKVTLPKRLWHPGLLDCPRRQKSIYMRVFCPCFVRGLSGFDVFIIVIMPKSTSFDQLQSQLPPPSKE
jgi:hypothetical protein